jgi:hypothetical protein
LIPNGCDNCGEAAAEFCGISGGPDGIDGESYCENESMLRNEEACMASSCCHWNTWEEGEASFNGEGRCWSSIGQDMCTDIVMPENPMSASSCDPLNVETFFAAVLNSETTECMSAMHTNDPSIDDICACLNSFDGRRFFTEDWNCYVQEGDEHTVAGYFEHCLMQSNEMIPTTPAVEAFSCR